MDIMVNCLCLLIIQCERETEASEIYDSVSIALIDSINQNIARNSQSRYRCETFERSLRFSRESD